MMMIMIILIKKILMYYNENDWDIYNMVKIVGWWGCKFEDGNYGVCLWF